MSSCFKLGVKCNIINWVSGGVISVRVISILKRLIKVIIRLLFGNYSINILKLFKLNYVIYNYGMSLVILFFREECCNVLVGMVCIVFIVGGSVVNMVVKMLMISFFNKFLVEMDIL